MAIDGAWQGSRLNVDRKMKKSSTHSSRQETAKKTCKQNGLSQATHITSLDDWGDGYTGAMVIVEQRIRQQLGKGGIVVYKNREMFGGGVFFYCWMCTNDKGRDTPNGGIRASSCHKGADEHGPPGTGQLASSMRTAIF